MEKAEPQLKKKKKRKKKKKEKKKKELNEKNGSRRWVRLQEL